MAVQYYPLAHRLEYLELLAINYMRFAELCFPVNNESDDDEMENEKTLDERKVQRNEKYIEIDRKMYQCEDFYASLWEDNDERDDYSKIAQIGESSNGITANNEEEPAVHSNRSETSMIVRQVFPKIPKKAKKLWFEDKNIRIDGKLYPSEKFLESLANSRASTINCKSPDNGENAGEENVEGLTTKNSCKQLAKAIWRCVRKGARVIRRACTALPLFARNCPRCESECHCEGVLCTINNCECKHPSAADKQD
uniref:CXC domain-containing protein n=1 Tax=Globodera pallida TaxID=36090 RepID=A0A183CCM7_GLOPA